MIVEMAGIKNNRNPINNIKPTGIDLLNAVNVHARNIPDTKNKTIDVIIFTLGLNIFYPFPCYV